MARPCDAVRGDHALAGSWREGMLVHHIEKDLLNDHGAETASAGLLVERGAFES